RWETWRERWPAVSGSQPMIWKKNASGAGGCAHRRPLALWPPGLLLTRHDNLRGRHRFADRRVDAPRTTPAVTARVRDTPRGFLFAGDALLDEVAHVAGMVALPFGAVSFAALLVQNTAPVARRQALRLTARREDDLLRRFDVVFRDTFVRDAVAARTPVRGRT